MTTLVDITNRALQSVGTRTTIASMTENSNEAIQANLIIQAVCDELTRMAPWNCATDYIPLQYITSAPGTPENATQPTSLWAKGQPAPPWAYEYQYPVNCLRPLWIVPQFQTGFSGGVPITAAITGGAAQYWSGPPVRFKVAIDQFYVVDSITIATAGTGYAINDLITMPLGPVTSPPIGAPAVFMVDAIGGGGSVSHAAIVNQILGVTSFPLGGSYFTKPTNPQAQASTTGSGTGASFNLFWKSTGKVSQRVILTNQENALLCYLRQNTDPNLCDPDFIEAWIKALAGRLAFQLTGDSAVANAALQEANVIIAKARQTDANEGLTVNDVTPDWIRIRGITWASEAGLPNSQYDWGPMFSMY